VATKGIRLASGAGRAGFFGRGGVGAEKLTQNYGEDIG